jgi:excisionase family DNA binding protein
MDPKSGLRFSQCALLSEMNVSTPSVNAPLSVDTFLDRNQLAALLRVTRRTIELWHRQGEHPPYLRAGRRKVLYRRTDIDAWLELRVVRSPDEDKRRSRAS